MHPRRVPVFFGILAKNIGRRFSTNIVGRFGIPATSSYFDVGRSSHYRELADGYFLLVGTQFSPAVGVGCCNS